MTDTPDERQAAAPPVRPVVLADDAMAEWRSLDSLEGIVETGPPRAASPAAAALDQARRIAPGLGVSALVAIAATFLSSHYGAPVMLFALLLGMAFNFLRTEERFLPGIAFAGRFVLRLGVGLLGARLTIDAIGALGLAPILLVLGTIAGTIAAGLVAGRMLRLGRDFALLSGGATAVCGASAALAIASVLPRTRTSERETIVVVLAVTSFSTLAMILYPILAGAVGLTDHQAGLFLGATIHDVAQVVGAGYSISPETGDLATYVKLLRVACLLPIVVGLSLAFGRVGASEDAGPHVRELVPWFLLLFIACVILASSVPLPAAVTDGMADLSRWALVTAVAGIGIKTSLKNLVEIGPRAIFLMAIETLFLLLVALGAILAWIPA